MNSVFSVFLSILLFLGSLFNPSTPTETDTGHEVSAAFAAQDTVSEADTSLPAAQILSALRPASDPAAFADIEYEHYDPEPLYDAADEIFALAEAGDTDGVLTLYDEMYAEMLYIDSLTTLAMLLSDADIYDEYRSGEYAYMNTLWSEAQDLLLSVGYDLLNTDCADAFAAHIGEETAELFLWYTPLTQDALDNSDRELSLIEEYRRQYDTIYDTEYVYQGKSWTLEALYGLSGNVLAFKDYDAYLEVYDGLQQALAEKFAPIYAELVSIWQEDARAAGYDCYSDYAYECLYARDYTPDDAQLFCDAVKPIARQYFADLYYSDISYGADTVTPVFSADELMTIIGEYLPRVDEALCEPWNALCDRELYDLAPASSGRFTGAYTTTMLYFRSPFLFATLEENCYDLATLTHEFGHFADFYFSPQTNFFTQTDSIDLSEIHSNGLQALFISFYDEIYTDNADTAEYLNLANLLENIIEGCLYDEFQRRILDTTEPLTAELINSIYTQVCAEYGLYDEPSWDSTWVFVTHNFEQPLYYISYAVSAMPALQLRNMAQEDFDAAAELYMNILRRGAHDDGYLTVLEECGLRTFSDTDAVEEVCVSVLNRLEDLNAQYSA